MSIRIECVVPSASQVGEGAVWDHLSGYLWWVDIPAGLIHRYSPDHQKNESFDFGEAVGCLAVREKGGLVLATRSGFWFYDPETGDREQISDPEADMPQNRFNDGATDAQGRFWAGSMTEGGAQPGGAFYRLDADLTVTRWRDGFYTTNGLAMSPDGDRIYFSDSFPDVRKIWTASYDGTTGTPGEPELFFDTSSVAGRPDGGTVDRDGYYWQAGVSGWQIYRISPDGEVAMTIDMPIERPTKPMFGGDNLDTLYVTSIGSGLTPGTEADQPLAGGLFAVTGLGVKGLPQTRFAG